MKLPLLAVAGLFASASFVFADPETNLRNLKTLQSPTLSAEELQQVLFSASFEQTYARPIKLELHNPFRDKSLRGVVIRVKAKPPKGEEQTLEVFADVRCGPLQSAELEVPLFNWEELLKGSPVITLQEVHYEIEPEMEMTVRDLKTLQAPAFSPEQMKQLRSTTSFSPDFPRTPIHVEIYNPFRDQSIRGIVLLVESKSADGKAQAIEVFADLDCGPLQSAELGVPVFNVAELAKGPAPKITLEEVHRQPLPEQPK